MASFTPRSVALSLTEERPSENGLRFCDLGNGWQRRGKSGKQNFQSSPKILTVECNVFRIHLENNSSDSNSDFPESATSRPATQKKKTSIVSGVQRTYANACLEGGIFAGWAQGSSLFDPGVYKIIA